MHGRTRSWVSREGGGLRAPGRGVSAHAGVRGASGQGGGGSRARALSAHGGGAGHTEGSHCALGGGAVSLAPIRGWGRVDVVSNSHLLPTRVARPLLFSAPHAPTPNSFQLESRDQRELGRVERAGESGTRCVQVRGWGDVWWALEAGTFIWASLEPLEPTRSWRAKKTTRGS